MTAAETTPTPEQVADRIITEWCEIAPGSPRDIIIAHIASAVEQARAEEREACAKVIDGFVVTYKAERADSDECGDGYGYNIYSRMVEAGETIAAAIRARAPSPGADEYPPPNDKLKDLYARGSEMLAPPPAAARAEGDELLLAGVEPAERFYVRAFLSSLTLSDLQVLAARHGCVVVPEARHEALERLFNAAYGLSFGTDWNNGSAAKHNGYRQKVLEALRDVLAASPEARHG